MGLEEALWIDIDLHADRAARLRSGGQHGPHETLHVGASLAMEKQAETMAAREQRQWRFGGSEHLDAGGRRRGATQAARMAFRLRSGRGADDNAGKAAEGRQA